MKLSLLFGALVPDIRKQLRDAKVKAKRGDVSQWQRDADALVRLSIHGLLPDSQVTAARRKLLKTILASVEV